MVQLAKRLQAIEPFHVMDILSKAKSLEQQGQDIIHLEVGEPDFADLPEIKQAGMQAIEQGKTKYTASVGLVQLQQKLQQFYLQYYQIDIQAKRFIITPGASSGLQLALSLLLDVNDSMLITQPGYPCNRHFIELLGANALSYELNKTQQFRIQDDINQQLKDQKACLVANPSNPTAVLLNDNEQDILVNACQQQDCQLIVDEIYQGLCYEGESFSTILHKDPEAIVINSFSKFFNMTGWRIGWVVVPESMVAAADKLAQNMYLSAPTAAQYAAIRALDDDVVAQLLQRQQQFKQRRDYLLEQLQRLGFLIHGNCGGAFYIYADASKFTNNAQQFCQDILVNTGVAITPGLDFSGPDAHLYVRFAYTCSINRLKQAVSRLQQYLEQ